MSQYRKVKINYSLWPIAFCYGIGVRFRNKLFNLGILKSHSFKSPVISVGNITVGGTGKTPHVEYLLRLLGKDFKTAVLSRGYKRKTKGFLLASNKTTSKDIGDEPFQIKQKFPDSIVAVDANRKRGIETLKHKFKDLKAIVLDDAFQHRNITPGLSILLVDYNRPITKDYFIPAGRLRDSKHEKRRAHIVVITKCPKSLKPIDRRIMMNEINLYPYQRIFFSRIAYKDLKPVFNINSKKSLKLSQVETDILLITGIANSVNIREHVSQYGKKIVHLNYPDHCNYTQAIKSEMESRLALLNKNSIIITTEKDAVKLANVGFNENIKKNMFYLPIEVEFTKDDKEYFNHLIIDYVKKNKRKQLLYR